MSKLCIQYIKYYSLSMIAKTFVSSLPLSLKIPTYTQASVSSNLKPSNTCKIKQEIALFMQFNKVML